jgi:glycosyltransferase involved in cell wall biosynthesis
MRIALVHNRYRSAGGEERHVDLLEDWLLTAGVEVRRFEIRSPTKVSPLERLKLGATLTYRPAGAHCIRHFLRRERPDLVHFHNIFPLLTPAAVREARHHGTPVVLTVHNYRFACPAGTLLRNGQIHEDCIEGSSLLCGLRNARGVWTESIAYGIALEIQRRTRMLQRWVDAYVTPSRFAALMLARAGYPKDRIHTISHGTPIAETPSRPGSYALYAGRLSPEKGTHTLIAASRLAPDVPLVVAGDGVLAPLLRAAAGAEIAYVGRVDHGKVDELMRLAAFTVIPSECYENQPYGALESMAVGTPLLASRLGGLAEIIEDGVNGVLVPPGDPTALADAMRDIWMDRSRVSEMGRRAWTDALERFAPRTHIERLVSLYQGLLSN